MRGNYWKIKNSYAAKSYIDQEVRERTAAAKRTTLRNTHHDQQPAAETNQGEAENRESNFEQLKKEIRHLENSQIMSMKYKCHTEPEESEGSYQFKSTGKEFFPSKKIAHFQKFKLYLKKKGRSKKLSFLLDTSKVAPNADFHCFDSLKIKDLNVETKGEVRLKKKETPYIVKKFYRPMTSSNKSLEELSTKSAQIRGRKLQTSVTNRRDKENILICCY